MDIDEYVRLVAKEEGLEEGREQGRVEGEEKRNRLFVENLLKEPGFSVKKIASLANVTVDFVNKVKKGAKVK